MNVLVERYQDYTMLGKGETDHLVVMDVKDEVGRSIGPTPMEMLLMSIGACSLIDVAGILEKMRHRIDKLSVDILAERAETYPRKLTTLELSYKLWGDVPKEKLEKAVSLSQKKYCSALASLDPSIKIVNNFQVF